MNDTKKTQRASMFAGLTPRQQGNLARLMTWVWNRDRAIAAERERIEHKRRSGGFPAQEAPDAE